MAQKKKQLAEVISINSSLDAELSKLGLTDYVKLAENFCDMDVTCVSTGFPQLDYILHPKKLGFPLGRDIELFSKQPEVGKTSISLEFLKATQRAGLRGLFGDVERTMTLDYLQEQGLQTRPDQNPDLYAVRLMRHEKVAIPAEIWLDSILKMCNTFDCIVVDSVAALEKKANLDKAPGEENIMCGISKLLSEFFKKNVSKRAAIIWVNQMRTKVGAYSPTGVTPLDTTGGKAIKFYASIRLELSLAEKIKDGKDGDPVGMKVRVFTEKNKIAPQWRQTNLSYLFGYGFSPAWDYMDMALKLGLIDKKGSWLAYDRWKIQGPLNFHKAMVEDPELFGAIKQIVDGDSVVEEMIEQCEAPVEVEEEAA